MLVKLRKYLFLKLIMIPLVSILIAVILNQWKSYNGILVFCICFLLVALVASLVGLYNLRILINKFANIGEYIVENNFINDDTNYVRGFLNDHVHKMVVSHSEVGLIIFFKFSNKKQPLRIPWKEVKEYKNLGKDNLTRFDFFSSNVKLYVPHNDKLSQAVKNGRSNK